VREFINIVEAGLTARPVTLQVHTASRVIPVYLKITNPKHFVALPDELRNAENYKKAQGIYFDKLRSEGYDSVIFGGGTYVLLDYNNPDRVKSAVGNRAFTNKKNIHESVTKKPWTFYHGTASDTFDRFNPEHAAKGETHWNPLGNGMYATNNPNFAANFGHNVHKVVIPAGATYKRINMGTWRSAGGGLVIRALRKAFKQCGQSFDDWQKGTKPKDAADRWKAREQSPEQRQKVSDFLINLNRLLERMSPYEGLFESAVLVHDACGADIATAYEKYLPQLSNGIFGKYDFVVFTETNDALGDWSNGGKSSWEVVIFNPVLQRTTAQ